MVSIKNILCPVDFFPASDAALNYAAGLAANYDAAVHLLHVVTPFNAGGYEHATDSAVLVKSLQESAMRELDNLVARVRQAGVPADGRLVIGDVYDEIKREIEVERPDLIVMGTHGRRGVERWFMGSTTERLLRHSPVPLVTITDQRERVRVPRFRRILVTTDFSEGTADALAYAFSIAQENESKVTLMHVLHDVTADLSGKYRESLIGGLRKQLEDLIPEEARTWCDVATQVETGVPYRIILRMIENERPDLVVMNIHGKGMLDRALLGSTAERIVRAASCPVMMIPPLRRKFKRRARPGGNRVAVA
jgi:nucleotide-binding universal stress UspA family protein